LQQFIRDEYHRRGYQEVISPNVFNIDLWKTSGHYDNYKDNMFLFESESQTFGMKPMNCPGHCVMFDSQKHSYRELPLRYADFGVLHRNEASGALSGLTRVRRFQQDDAHIFCRPDQIEAEISGVLDMLKTVYGVFGFNYQLTLSTRPEKFLGEIETWNAAEEALQRCLQTHYGDKWKVNPGDGAFYGPNIDIQLQYALKRNHQCATIQLDFQLPRRFKLHYHDSNDHEAVPVMIHRAILGSLERIIAVLTEHFAAKFPFWMSPSQVRIIPVAEFGNEFANEIQTLLHEHRFTVEADLSNDTIKKKIRNAQIDLVNFSIVVGQQEINTRTLTLRNNRLKEAAAGSLKTLPIAEAIELLNTIRSKRLKDHEIAELMGHEAAVVLGSPAAASSSAAAAEEPDNN